MATQGTASEVRGRPTSRTADRRPSRRAPRITLSGVTVVIVTLLALFLRLHELMRPGLLHGVEQYDDGVYLGSAIRLADGVVPYRDFAIVQPPGIVLLMLPLGFLAKSTGTAAAMVIARILTACVGAVTVALTGLLVRHRGTVAVLLSAGILAVHPGTLYSSSTLLLEPWLILFCLLGALAIFERDDLTTSGWRVLLGGVAIGFAGAIKAFALFPALALLVILLAAARWRRTAIYLGGLVIGFAVPSLPFLILSGQRFINEVIVAQLQRTDVSQVPVTLRMITLFGTPYLNLSADQVRYAAALIVLSVAICMVASSLLARRPPPMLDWWAMIASAVAFGGFLIPADFYEHYAGAFAPFLALAIGLSVGRLVNVLAGHTPEGASGHTPARALGRPRRTPTARAAVITGAGAVAAVALVTWMAVTDVNHERLHAAPLHLASVRRAIPPGACVLADEVSVTIMVDRFTSRVPGCSRMVDSLGTDLGLGGAHIALNGAGSYPAVQAAWLAAFRHAQYVWLQCYPPKRVICNRFTNRRVPWTPAIRGYFLAHFHHSAAPRLFVRNGLRSSTIQ